MRGRKPAVYFVGLVYLVISNILSELSMRIQLGDTDINLLAEEIMQGNEFVLPELPLWGSVLLMAVSVMSSVLAAGFQNYCLKVSRRQQAGVGEIFDVFGIFFKVFALLMVEGILIMLWGMLFVIPGIIASIRYSMAIYILLDDPDKGIMQCLRESKAMTYGYKWKLFVFRLSYIGWAILAAIPTGFASVSYWLAIAGGVIVSAFVTPYMEIGYANCYNRLSGWRAEADVIIE